MDGFPFPPVGPTAGAMQPTISAGVKEQQRLSQ